MADETTVVAAATDATDAQAKDTATGDATGKTTAETPKTFTQAELESIIKDRLGREQKKAADTLAKAQADAEAKALAEQGNFKALYEKAQADLLTNQQRIKAMEQDAARRGVASRLGLPELFIGRLRGETVDEIEADAKALLAAIPKPAAPNINAGAGSGAAPQPGQLSDDERAELAAIYGVNPKFLK